MPNYASTAKLSIEYLKRCLGVGVPDRLVNLSFPAAPKNKRKEQPVTQIKQLQTAYKAIASSPLQTLESARKELTLIVAVPVSVSDRDRLNEFYWQHLYPYLLIVLRKYRKDGALHDDTDRQTLLDCAFDCLELLRKNGQFVFSADYRCHALVYAYRQFRLIRSGAMVMEAVQLQQLIGALRYRPLGGGAWLALNKCFHILREYEPQAVTSFLPFVHGNEDGKQAKTLEMHYVNTQLVGYFDLLRYSSEQQANLVSLVDAFAPQVQLTLLDRVAQLGANYLVLSHLQDGAPFIRQQMDAKEIPGSLLNLRLLKLEISKVVQAFKDSQDNQAGFTKSPLFMKIPHRFRRSIFTSILSRVRNEDPIFVSNNLGKTVQFYGYCGFMDCYELKLDDKRGVDRSKRKTSILTMEAEHDNGVTYRATTEDWTLLEEHGNHLHFQTQDTSTTLPMTVGGMVCFSLEGLVASGVYKFGLVTRIQRLSGARANSQLVNVDIRLFAEHGEAVGYLSDGDDQKVYPGLLMNNHDAWQVAIPTSNVKRLHQTVTLLRSSRQFTVTLGREILSTAEFTILDVMGDCLKDFGPLFQKGQGDSRVLGEQVSINPDDVTLPSGIKSVSVNDDTARVVSLHPSKKE